MNIQSVQSIGINRQIHSTQPAFKGDYDELDQKPYKPTNKDREQIVGTVDRAMKSDKMPKFLKAAIVVGATAIVGYFGGKFVVNKGLSFLDGVDTESRFFNGVADKLEKGVTWLKGKFPKTEETQKGVKAFIGNVVEKFDNWSKKGLNAEDILNRFEKSWIEKKMTPEAMQARAAELATKGPIKRFFNSLGGIIGSIVTAIKGSKDKDENGNPDGLSFVKNAAGVLFDNVTKV